MSRRVTELQHIRAFIAVAREGNLTRASQQLHLTQPAVSVQLKRMQDALNLRLFTRSLSGLEITSSGEKLLPLAERILGALEDFEQMADSMQDALHGTLSMGTILNPDSVRLSQILQHLFEHHAGLTTKLRHGMTGWVQEQVLNGELDAGFYLGFPEDIDPAVFHAAKLTELTYYIIAPKGWQDRIANKGWPELASQPWVWTPPSSAHHRMLSRVFRAAGVQPCIAAEVDLEASMIDLVRSGVGLSLARDSLAQREEQDHDVVVERGLPIRIPMWFIARAGRKDDPMVKAVFTAVTAAFQ
ncbi:MAG: LysR family transcriptional regulator [Pusillimonas sp.]